ncbi:MAG: OmpA family protein [Cytophagaceae bacterium]|jgi:outer membrane protein OmpA-like peptidoglycan-associated protein|nr:OmpA family protein [Cytophagaceae bacterium]
MVKRIYRIGIAVLLFVFFVQATQQDKPSAQLVSLGTPINTLDHAEFSPTVSADGNTMIFESNRGGRWRLYITQQTKPDVWSLPQELTVVSNFVGPEDFLGGPCLSYDGKTLFFTSNRKGSLGGIDIWYTKRTGTTWEVPKNMGQGVNSSGYDGFPSLSADGKQLYFMRDGRNKRMTSSKQVCCSLYVAEKRGAFYMNAKALPLPINTGCEAYPRIMADNKTLIFSRYKDKTNTGYDLYESKLRGGKWTAPVPMSFINTHRDDELISVPEAGDIIYLSNTSSNNLDDIYKVELPKEFRPDKIVTLEGVVRESENNKIIPATIKVTNLDTKETTEVKNNETTGKYKIALEEGEKYDIAISSQGKSFESELVDLSQVKKYQIVNKDIKLKPLKANTSFTLNNIFFGFDSSALKPQSELELNRVVDMLLKNPSMQVEISAHTDDKGSEAYNLKLSQSRAESVVGFLVSKGINKDRLIPKGYGKSKPTVPNDSEENRAKNRRVEFKIVKI